MRPPGGRSGKPGQNAAKALAVGLLTALVLSAVMLPLFRLGLTPLPKPLGLAFAQVLLGPVPLPVGLLFHVVYVTLWSTVFVLWFPRRDLKAALGLGLVLWAIAVAVFFPVVGWGFAGSAVGSGAALGALFVHLLFALVLWALSRWALGPRA